MKIVYDYMAARKCRLWSENAGKEEDGTGTLTEVGWLGQVYTDGDDFYIVDVFLLPHKEFSGGHYKIAPEEVSLFYAEYIQNGGEPGDIKHFGHSHGSGSVFQSATDRDNVKEGFGKKQYCVAVTWNSKGEMYGEITMFQPFFYRFRDVPVEIEHYQDSQFDKEVLAELREKVPPGRRFHQSWEGETYSWLNDTHTPSGHRHERVGWGGRTQERPAPAGGEQESLSQEETEDTQDARNGNALSLIEQKANDGLVFFEGMCVVLESGRLFHMDNDVLWEWIPDAKDEDGGDWFMVDDLRTKVLVLHKLEEGHGYEPDADQPEIARMRQGEDAEAASSGEDDTNESDYPKAEITD